MDTAENINMVYPVDKALEDVVAAVKFNNGLPPEMRNNVITVVKQEKRPEMLVVNGSAHMLEPLFIELFKKRPELRWVVQNVLRQMFYIADL